MALASDVATLTVNINDGNIPAVGSLVSVSGTTTGAGEFNVSNVALTGVTLDETGAGTVTFALVEADVAPTPDGGIAIVPQPEVGETLVNGASVAVGLPYGVINCNTETTQSVTAIVSFPSLPTTATISLQGAIVDKDSDYQTLGTVATVAGGTQTAAFLNYIGKFNFYRLLAASVTGGTPTIVGKILI